MRLEPFAPLVVAIGVDLERQNVMGGGTKVDSWDGFQEP